MLVIIIWTNTAILWTVKLGFGFVDNDMAWNFSSRSIRSTSKDLGAHLQGTKVEDELFLNGSGRFWETRPWFYPPLSDFRSAIIELSEFVEGMVLMWADFPPYSLCLFRPSSPSSWNPAVESNSIELCNSMDPEDYEKVLRLHGFVLFSEGCGSLPNKVGRILSLVNGERKTPWHHVQLVHMKICLGNSQLVLCHEKWYKSEWCKGWVTNNSSSAVTSNFREIIDLLSCKHDSAK